MPEEFRWYEDSKECNEYCAAYFSHDLVYYHGDPYLVVGCGSPCDGVVSFTVKRAESCDLEPYQQHEIYANKFLEATFG